MMKSRHLTGQARKRPHQALPPGMYSPSPRGDADPGTRRFSSVHPMITTHTDPVSIDIGSVETAQYSERGKKAGPESKHRSLSGNENLPDSSIQPKIDMFTYNNKNDLGWACKLLALRLYGPLSLKGPEGTDLTPRSQKTRALVAMLAVSDSGQRSRAWLIDHLWSESPQHKAQASLRQALRELRITLGGLAQGLLTTDKFTVGLDLGKIHQVPRASRGDDFLEGIDIGDPEFEEWLTVQRNRRAEAMASGAGLDVSPSAAPEATPCSGFGLRVDPAILPEPDPETAYVANAVLDCILASLAEEGFDRIEDRRRETIFGTTHQGANFALCLRIRIHRRGEHFLIKLALIDLAGERTVWYRGFIAEAEAIRSERHSELLTTIAQCVDHVWLAKDRFIREAKAGEDDADVLRVALEDMFELSAADLDRAEKLLRQLMRTPRGPLASAWLAFLLTFRVGQRFVLIDSAIHEEARYLVNRAVELAPQNSVVLALAAHVHGYLFGNYVRAVELFETAVKANVARPIVWDLYSVLHAYMGLPVPGLKCARFARHLGAHSIYRYYFDTSCLITASLAGEHELAIGYGKAVLEERPEFNSALRYMTASYAHQGDNINAALMRDRLFAVEPNFSISTLRDARYPGLETPAGAYFINGLKKAGIKEATQ